MELHEAIKRIKSLAKTLDKIPTRNDLLKHGFTDWFLRKYEFSDLLNKAGLEKPTIKISKKRAKILVLDIETSYLELIGYGLFNQNFGINDIEKDWSILSYCASYIGEEKIYYNDTRKRKDKRDDSKLVKELERLIERSDAVITWNGDKFDLKKIRSRMFFYGHFPQKKIISEDLYKVVKNLFGEASNKLDFWAQKFGCGSKLKGRKFQGKELTRQCLLGNKEAWEEMERYNKMDVEITKKLYFKISPWSSKINANLFNQTHAYVCRCGSTDFKHSGFAYTKNNRYQVIRCKECGANYRSPKNDLDKKRLEFMPRL